MTKPTLERLFDALDREAEKMLQDMSASDDEGEGEGPVAVDFIERARVFGEVSRYAFERRKMGPAPNRVLKGKFHDLKDRFHGNPPEGGTRKPRGKTP